MGNQGWLESPSAPRLEVTFTDRGTTKSSRVRLKPCRESTVTHHHRVPAGPCAGPCGAAWAATPQRRVKVSKRRCSDDDADLLLFMLFSHPGKAEVHRISGNDHGGDRFGACQEPSGLTNWSIEPVWRISDVLKAQPRGDFQAWLRPQARQELRTKKQTRRICIEFRSKQDGLLQTPFSFPPFPSKMTTMGHRVDSSRAETSSIDIIAG
jgi:hypothetical protein